MPCMCGDIYCPSCGPAQGNYRCPACGSWTADGGCEDPTTCDAIVKKMDEDEERWYLVDEIYQRIAKEQNVSLIDVKVPEGEYKKWRDMPIEELRKLKDNSEYIGSLA